MTDLKTEFWDRIGHVRSCMLGIKGDGSLVPMSPRIDADLPGNIWFITAKDADHGKGVTKDPQAAQLVIVDDSAGLYADVEGRLTHSTDPKALDEIWSTSAEAWFDKGQDRPRCLPDAVRPRHGRNLDHAGQRGEVPVRNRQGAHHRHRA